MAGRPRSRKRFDFGDAANYDRVRPAYPERLVDDVIEFAGGPDAGPALEVGCGTGKATVAFAQRGVDILAIDPLPAMADIAREACAPFPNVEVRTAAFEDLDRARSAPFTLVFAAAAWHMVPQDVGFTKAHLLLRPGGVLALFRYRTQWIGNPLRDALTDVYRDAPALAAGSQWNPAAQRRDLFDDWTAAAVASALFADPVVSEYTATTTYSTAEYLGVLQTQRDHATLPARSRKRLFGAVAGVIDAHREEIRVDRSFRLLMSRRVD